MYIYTKNNEMTIFQRMPLEMKSVERSGIDKIISFFVLLIQNPSYEEYTSNIITICCNISLSATEVLDVGVESNKLLCTCVLCYNSALNFTLRSYLLIQEH